MGYRRRYSGNGAGMSEGAFAFAMLIGGFFTFGITWIALIAYYATAGSSPKRLTAAQRESSRQDDYKRMKDYAGSPAYQAMLKRNGGVAPGSREVNRVPSVFIGPRGGRYRINSKGRKSYDVH